MCIPLLRGTRDANVKIPLFVIVTGCDEAAVEDAKGWRNMVCYASWNESLRRAGCNVRQSVDRFGRVLLVKNKQRFCYLIS